MSLAPSLTTDGQIATDDDRTTQIYSPFSGQITKIFVRPGQDVRKGAPIYSVAASELVQVRNDLAAGEASVSAARGALAVAEASAARQQALLKVEGAALRDVQQSQSDLATARSNLASAEAQVAAARGRASILGLQPHAAAKTAGNQAIVRSPIAGTVILRQAGIGQYVESAASGASTPLFSISDLSRVWLVANVREADAGRVRPGAQLEISVPAYPGRLFSGRVYYVSPIIDPNTRRIAVRAEIANPDHALKPNMFATARLSDGATRSAVEVPSDAVLYEGDTARLWIAYPDRHTLALREVRAGATADGKTTIVDGLSPGEHVVGAGSVFIDRENRSDGT